VLDGKYGFFVECAHKSQIGITKYQNQIRIILNIIAETVAFVPLGQLLLSQCSIIIRDGAAQA
jgi:hypothetical protein